MKNKWFVLYVKNKKEKIVRRELPFESIVPMIEEKVVSKKGVVDQQVTIVELMPKYPNYVFVKHDGSKGFFDKCLSHLDVVSFAGGTFNEDTGEFPEPLLDSDVKNIFENELSRNFCEGARVVIVDGPYQGQKGIIKSIKQDMCLIKIKVFDVEVNEWIPEEFVINERKDS